MLKPLGPLLASSKNFDFLWLLRRWHEVVGPALAKHTIPLKNKGGVLTILTDHPAFAQELSFLQGPLKEKIVARFPALAGQLKKLYFQYNPQFFQRKKGQVQAQAQVKAQAQAQAQEWILHPLSPEHKKWKKKAQELLGDIEDPELEDLLTSLFLQFKGDPAHRKVSEREVDG